MYGNVCLGASVVAAYTNDGYLRDAYRRVTGAYGSLIAVDQGAWSLKGIRMCTSRRLDSRIKQFSIFFHLNQAVSNRWPGLRLQNIRRLTTSQ
jgi:hypothetical protein